LSQAATSSSSLLNSKSFDLSVAWCSWYSRSTLSRSFSQRLLVHHFLLNSKHQATWSGSSSSDLRYGETLSQEDPLFSIGPNGSRRLALSDFLPPLPRSTKSEITNELMLLQAPVVRNLLSLL
jgi:hypothetical protein